MIAQTEDYIDHIPRSFDHWLNSWSYYNTSSEEGLYAHYYLDETQYKADRWLQEHKTECGACTDYGLCTIAERLYHDMLKR